MGFGKWDYNYLKDTGNLRHTSRTQGASGQAANDGFSGSDKYNIAVNDGSEGIVPQYLHDGVELAYPDHGWANFSFYLR